MEEITEIFISLPSGAISVKELQQAFQRLANGTPSWSDVRVVKEALDLLEALVRWDQK